MGVQQLISIAVTLAFLALSSGQLPKFLEELKTAQLQLIKESQASKWGKPWTPPRR